MSDDPPDEIHGCARYEWERIVRRVLMPGPTKAVAFALATYANQDGSSIFPGTERLVAVSCYTDKTVRVALDWLRKGYLIDRVRKGSSLGRKAMADEYRLVLPSDLLTRHTLLDPSETPVTRTGDQPVDNAGSPVAPTGDRQEHRYLLPGTPVTETGTPVAPTGNTGSSYRPPTHNHPLPLQDQREDQVRDSSTEGGDDNLLAELIRIDELAARRAVNQ